MNVLPWIIAVYGLQIALGYLLDVLNLKRLRERGGEVPAEFRGHIDPALLARTRDYVLEKTRFSFLASAFGHILLIGLIFGGLLGLYNAWILSWNWPFLAAGVAFFLLLSFAQTLLGLPWDAYRTFKIEAKYGFNTTTPGLWWLDLAKSLLVSTLLAGILLCAGLWIMQRFPDQWWFLLWLFYAGFSLFLMYLSPYVIEPLFNKFTPLEEGPLTDRIRELLGRAGIQVGRVFRMDASRRSRHTNAYFTGIGRVKRIVLFDTLLEKMSEDELVAVLAHEAGHWKKKHLLKNLLTSEAAALAGMYLAYRLLADDRLIRIFGLATDSLFARITLLGFLFSLAAFWTAPAVNALSRWHERQADDFAVRLTGEPAGLANALVKLSKDNLANLHPHPWYAWAHYSHPPVVARVRRLNAQLPEQSKID